MQKKIKIIFAASSLTGGGAERVFLNIMSSLPLDQYEIMLLTTSKYPAAEEIEVDERIKTVACNKVHAREAFFCFLNYIKTFSPDYIFTSHFLVAYMLPILRFLARRHFKIIVRVAVPPSEAVKRSGIVRLKSAVAKFLSKPGYKRTDLVIAQTHFMKKDMQKHYGVNPAKIKVIRNIISEKFLEARGDKFVPNEFSEQCYNIVASGALYSIKGFDLLIKAVAGLMPQHPNIRLYILGDERYERGYRDKLEQLIETLSLQNKVILIGFKENPYPYYKNADLFVLSSRKEGYPNVVLEALYYGTPVVATDCVDFREVVSEGVNGYVVAKDSLDALAEGIERAISNLKRPCVTKLVNFDYTEVFK